MTCAHENADAVGNVERARIYVDSILVCNVDTAGNIAGGFDVGVENAAVDCNFAAVCGRTVRCDNGVVLCGECAVIYSQLAAAEQCASNFLRCEVTAVDNNFAAIDPENIVAGVDSTARYRELCTGIDCDKIICCSYCFAVQLNGYVFACRNLER